MLSVVTMLSTVKLGFFSPTKTRTVSNEMNPFPLFSNCSNSKKAEMENRNRKLYFYCVDLDKQTVLRPVSSRQGA